MENNHETSFKDLRNYQILNILYILSCIFKKLKEKKKLKHTNNPQCQRIEGKSETRLFPNNKK